MPPSTASGGAAGRFFFFFSSSGVQLSVFHEPGETADWLVRIIGKLVGQFGAEEC